MYLANMRIQNYRRFKDTFISFEPNDTEPTKNELKKEESGGVESKPIHNEVSGVTMLVGANNSGKTSIVELLQRMLSERTQTSVPFSFSDFNINVRNQWLKDAHMSVYKYFSSQSSSVAENVDADTNKDDNVSSEADSEKPDIKEDAFYKLLDKIITHKRDSQNPEMAQEPTNPESKTKTDDSGVSPAIAIELTISFKAEDDLQDIVDYLLHFNKNEITNRVYFKYVIEADMSKLLGSNDGKKMIESYRQRLKTLFDGKQNEEKTAKGGQHPSEEVGRDRIYKVIDEILDDCFSRTLVEKVYYCDSTFTQKRIINPTERFRKLFNVCAITARRDLDDTQGDHSNTLSSRLMRTVTNDEAWGRVMTSLQVAIFNALDGEDYKKAIANEASQSLNTVITGIDQANGGHTESVTLNGRITFDAVERFLSNHTVAEFGDDSLALGEQSQGLGYSNLIYILIEFLSFLESCKKSIRKINLLIIEEPESHMHPQMQSVFIREVFQRIRKIAESAAKTIDSASQYFAPTCLITSHSAQIVREARLQQIRVARPENYKPSEGATEEHTVPDSVIINLKEKLLGHEDGEADKEMTDRRRMYEILFDLNFADIVFADKVILFEGDTERMYLQALIQGAGRSSDKSDNDKTSNDKTVDFKKLRQQYIAYVQVGGRHAFQYKKLLEILGVRSVIITDIDYCKLSKSSKKSKEESRASSGDSDYSKKSEQSADPIQSVDDIRQLVTTNPTINRCLKLVSRGNRKNNQISNVYNHLTGEANSKRIFEIKDTNIAVSCQTDADGYSRTLEEAMLCKLFDIENVVVPVTRSEWEEHQKALALGECSDSSSALPLPDEDSIRVRDVVNRIAGSSKTNFMYAIILSGNALKAMPRYIEDSLTWLAED